MEKSSFSIKTHLTDNDIKILIVTYDFPPMGGTAVQRVKSFVKYLPDHGITPIVLTINILNRDELIDKNNGRAENILSHGYVYRSFCLDAQLIADRLNYFGFSKSAYNEAKNVYAMRKKTGMSRIIDLYNRFMIPDAKLFWTPFALKKAQTIFSEHKIDAILSTSPRATAHVIAYILSNKFNVPSICDFRDPWTQGKVEISRPFPTKNIDLFLEKLIVYHAYTVICVTNEIRNDFIQRYPEVKEDKFIVITNGFDREELQSIRPYSYEKYTIVYAGRNYEGKGNIPDILMKINTIRNKHNIDIAFHYIGSDYKSISAFTKTYALDFVRITSFVPHPDVLRYIKGAHALYLYPHNERIPPLTGKLFEYIGAQRFIVAMTDKQSEMAQIIRNTQSGLIIDSHEDNILEKFLIHEYEDFTKERKPKLLNNESLISQYERRHLASLIASVIKSGCNLFG
jgi:hypothetical protein